MLNKREVVMGIFLVLSLVALFDAYRQVRVGEQSAADAGSQIEGMKNVCYRFVQDRAACERTLTECGGEQ